MQKRPPKLLDDPCYSGMLTGKHYQFGATI